MNWHPEQIVKKLMIIVLCKNVKCYRTYKVCVIVLLNAFWAPLTVFGNANANLTIK